MIRRTLLALAAIGLVATPAFAKDDSEFLNKKPAEWTADDIAAIFGKSAWTSTQQVMPTALASPDGKMSGPTKTGNRVPVQARWFSAGLIRRAIARNAELNGANMTPEEKSEQFRADDRFYEILISAEHLDVLDAVKFEDLAKHTTLTIGDETLPLVNLLRPAELRGPQAQFLFARGKGNADTAKTAVLKTQWGDSKIEFTWDLTKMSWPAECENGEKPVSHIVSKDEKAGKIVVRDLDGDFCAVGPKEQVRRELQSAVLGSGDEALNRAVSDVRTQWKDKKFSGYVFYNPGKELASETEAKAVDPVARKEAMTRAVGAWLEKSHKGDLEALIFVDPKLGKATDYVMGVDAEKLAKLSGAEADKFFKEKLQKPDAPAKPAPKTEKPSDGKTEKAAPKKK